jgi:hypothetical protein
MSDAASTRLASESYSKSQSPQDEGSDQEDLLDVKIEDRTADEDEDKDKDEDEDEDDNEVELGADESVIHIFGHTMHPESNLHIDT